jgi:hypothetical protein
MIPLPTIAHNLHTCSFWCCSFSILRCSEGDRQAADARAGAGDTRNSFASFVPATNPRSTEKSRHYRGSSSSRGVLPMLGAGAGMAS